MFTVSMLLTQVSFLLTFGFVQQVQTADTTMFLVMENIFYSGLDGTMIVYSPGVSKSNGRRAK